MGGVIHDTHTHTHTRQSIEKIVPDVATKILVAVIVHCFAQEGGEEE